MNKKGKELKEQPKKKKRKKRKRINVGLNES